MMRRSPFLYDTHAAVPSAPEAIPATLGGEIRPARCRCYIPADETPRGRQKELTRNGR